MAEKIGTPPPDSDGQSVGTTGGRLPVACPFVKGQNGETLSCVGSGSNARKCRLFDRLNSPDGKGPTSVTPPMRPQCARVRGAR